MKKKICACDFEGGAVGVLPEMMDDKDEKTWSRGTRHLADDPNELERVAQRLEEIAMDDKRLGLLLKQSEPEPFNDDQKYRILERACARGFGHPNSVLIEANAAAWNTARQPLLIAPAQRLWVFMFWGAVAFLVAGLSHLRFFGGKVPRHPDASLNEHRGRQPSGQDGPKHEKWGACPLVGLIL